MRRRTRTLLHRVRPAGRGDRRRLEARPVRQPQDPASHYETTGPEIWADTDGRVTHFVAGVGTGGTISGTGRYLKDVSDGQVQVIGADPEGSVYSGGTGRPYLVEGVGEDFWPAAYDPTVPDEIIAVSDADSFEMTRRLAREEGLLVGGSCGMAVAAALEVAREGRTRRVVVVLLPDGGRGYLSKIFYDGWMSSYGFLPRLDGRRRGHRRRCAARQDGRLPDLVHTHPNETVRDAVEIMHEYGVSQMPVVGAEPPVMAGEVVGASPNGSCCPRCSRAAPLADAVSRHMARRCRWSGPANIGNAAAKALRDSDALMVVDDGKPVGVMTRSDLLGYLSDGPRRRIGGGTGEAPLTAILS